MEGEQELRMSFKVCIRNFAMLSTEISILQKHATCIKSLKFHVGIKFSVNFSDTMQCDLREVHLSALNIKGITVCSLSEFEVQKGTDLIIFGCSLIRRLLN
jgi:hypothetical protein